MSNSSTRATSPRTMLGRCRPARSNSPRRNKGSRNDAIPRVRSSVTTTALDHNNHSRRSTLLIPARTEGALRSRSRNVAEGEFFIRSDESNFVSAIASPHRLAKRWQTNAITDYVAFHAQNYRSDLGARQTSAVGESLIGSVQHEHRLDVPQNQ